MSIIGNNIPRLESQDKVTGRAKYTADYARPGMLHARLVTSPLAHARIKRIDASAASLAPGVQAVITGESCAHLYGQLLEDRPLLAIGKVRHYGEALAVVVANSEAEAFAAANLVTVELEPLPVVNTIRDALQPGAPLLHEQQALYAHYIPGVRPEPGTNVAHRAQVRKGDLASAWQQSDVTIDCRVQLPQADHAAMETRVALVEISPSGQVTVQAASQGPFFLQKIISHVFGLEMSQVVVKTGLVGGAFGGKATATAELLAYLASKAVGGKLVKLAYTREQDIITAPGHIGMEAEIKLGATREGKLLAADLLYLTTCGAYTDSSPTMAQAIAASCTGPYNVPNVSCDSLLVYTNHPYTTAFRGFGHEVMTFAIERAMDKLAVALQLDPLELRLRNAIRPGDISPSYEHLNASLVGDLPTCLQKMRSLIGWQSGQVVPTADGKLRAKSVACFWKTSSSPVNAISGVILTMNKDGSINLNSGVVEIGQATKTVLAQILAEKLKLPINRIHVVMPVDTEVSPEHWKTVASKSTYMAGRALLRAAETLIGELRNVASQALRVPPEELDVAGGKVYAVADPTVNIDFADIAHGYKYDNGNSIGGQLMARGSFIMPRLTPLDPETGKGRSGPAWTVGCQAVEVEYDPQNFTYQVLQAATVVDLGKALNPQNARAVLTGGMCMGLGLATREELTFDPEGIVQNAQLRTYKLMRFGEHPQYLVEFVETPQLDAPFGQRGIAEHGILAIPAAVAGALSVAAGVDFDQLPILPETIWQAKTGGEA